MNEEEADIKNIIGKAFYTKLEEIWLKKRPFWAAR